jgi:hypothetical protein
MKDKHKEKRRKGKGKSYNKKTIKFLILNDFVPSENLLLLHMHIFILWYKISHISPFFPENGFHII